MAILYWILCLLIGLVPAYFVFQKDRKRTIKVKWLPALLRLLILSLTAALLLTPAFPGHRMIEEKPIVIWLQDESASIAGALSRDSTEYRKKVTELWHASSQTWRFLPLGFGTALQGTADFSYQQKGSDISTAVQETLRRYRNSNVAAIVVASDGNYNTGSNPVYDLQSVSIPIYTIGLGDSTRPRDLSVTFAHANKTVSLGNTFELQVHLQADKLSGQSGMLQVIHQGQTVAQQPFSVIGNSYSNAFRFYLKADKEGLQHYTVSVAPLTGEQNVHNNQRDVFVNVLQQKTHILIAAAAPHPDIAAIKEALGDPSEYSIEIKYGSDVPATVSNKDLLITHNLPDNKGIQIPQHEDVPVWHIIGPQTDLLTFSKQQKLLGIQAGHGFDDIRPIENHNFNLFAPPEDIRLVMAQMPPLKVPDADYQLHEGQALLLQKEHNMPLWVLANDAHYPQAILCGTGIWRWRLYAFKSFKQTQSIDDLIRQTISLLTYRHHHKSFTIHLSQYRFQDNEPVIFSAGLRDATGRLTNEPEVTLSIWDSTAKERHYTFNAVGQSYQLIVRDLPAGNYTFHGSVHFNGVEETDKGSFQISSIPLEQLKTYSDYELLYQLAHNTGGDFFTLRDINRLHGVLNNNPNMKPVLREETRHYHWIDLKWFFFLILFTATGEWLLRKYWGL